MQELELSFVAQCFEGRQPTSADQQNVAGLEEHSIGGCDFLYLRNRDRIGGKRVVSHMFRPSPGCTIKENSTASNRLCCNICLRSVLSSGLKVRYGAKSIDGLSQQNQ